MSDGSYSFFTNVPVIDRLSGETGVRISIRFFWLKFTQKIIFHLISFFQDRARRRL